MDADQDGAISNPMEADPGKMFIGGLHAQTSADVLQRYFEQYGEVKECVVMRDSVTKRSRGFGFVRFTDTTSVDKVANNPTHTIDGKKVDPKRAIPKRPPPGTNQYKKVFVGGLPPDTTVQDMKDYFETFGKVNEVLLMHDRNTKRLRGFGFVTFESDLAGKNVCEAGFHKLKGKSVECKRAQPKEVMMLQVNLPFPFGRGYPAAFGGPLGFGYPAEWALNPQIYQNIASMYQRSGFTNQGFMGMDQRRAGGSQYYAEYANAATQQNNGQQQSINRREHSPTNSTAVVTTNDHTPHDYDHNHYSTVQLTQYNAQVPHSPLAQSFSQNSSAGHDAMSYLQSSRHSAAAAAAHIDSHLGPYAPNSTAHAHQHTHAHHQSSNSAAAVQQHAAFAHGMPQIAVYN